MKANASKLCSTAAGDAGPCLQMAGDADPRLQVVLQLVISHQQHRIAMQPHAKLRAPRTILISQQQPELTEELTPTAISWPLQQLACLQDSILALQQRQWYLIRLLLLLWEPGLVSSAPQVANVCHSATFHIATCEHTWRLELHCESAPVPKCRRSQTPVSPC
jgi:hypothetical protein